MVGGSWSPCFSRPFNDWEVDYVDRFLLSLHGKRVHRDENNKVLWKVTKNGKFIVRFVYNALELDSSISFPMKIIWNLWV